MHFTFGWSSCCGKRRLGPGERTRQLVGVALATRGSMLHLWPQAGLKKATIDPAVTANKQLLLLDHSILHGCRSCPQATCMEMPHLVWTAPPIRLSVELILSVWCGSNSTLEGRAGAACKDRYTCVSDVDAQGQEPPSHEESREVCFRGKEKLLWQVSSIIHSTTFKLLQSRLPLCTYSAAQPHGQFPTPLTGIGFIDPGICNRASSHGHIV
ncbi:uncharacterized protein B0T15DRAFT_292029 [Chaetomium strumarium]|uniref:Uncharacterized protein n=1 Tax=Chaetomium strumarium TaxID=1170767 RepID=A0AAJ0GLI4_9PEZI|nr:hypothetical protein B0T15DRAFT_292029 [Chaetomium strumarium]